MNTTTQNLTVVVTFENGKARRAFRHAWCKRASEIDVIESGVTYAGDNAERALDIALELDGVSVKVFEGG